MNENMFQAIEKDSMYAIIPARAGSKGVKNKNIRCLKGYPMLAYSIAAAKLCPAISRIIVSTDSEAYARIARYYGAETPFLRPAELAGDKAADIEFMEHAITWLFEHEQRLPEYFMHLRPTYPLREQDVVNAAVNKMSADPMATSLRSAHRSPAAPYKWFSMRDDGYYKCLFGGLTLDEANSPRQDFPNVYIPDGYVDILKTEFIIKNRLMHGDRVIGYVVPDGVDVDAMQDFQHLEHYMEDHDPAIYCYLKENYKTMGDAEL